MLAAVQAPVIMMTQNRQDAKDRVRGRLDYQVNRRSESEIQGLDRKLNVLDDKLGDGRRLVAEETIGKPTLIWAKPAFDRRACKR